MTPISVIQAKAEAMPPEEAVDYLLWQIELLSEAMIGTAHHPVDDLGVHYTPAERRIMVCLYDADQNLRTKRQVHSAMVFGGPGEETEPNIVRVMIHNLRRKLPAGKMQIKTHVGVGYSLHIEQPTSSTPTQAEAQGVKLF